MIHTTATSLCLDRKVLFPIHLLLPSVSFYGAHVTVTTQELD